MKKTYLLFLVLMTAAGLFAQSSRSFSMQEAIEYAMNNSIDVRDAQIAVSDADERVVESKAIGFPQLDFKSDFTRYLKLPVTILPDEFGINPMTGQVDPDFNNEVQFGSKNNFGMGLEFSSLLFDGTYFTGLEAARFYTGQVRQQLTQKKDEIRNNVRDAYLPTLIFAENRKILEKNIANLEKMFFETKELYKAGFVEQLDVDRLELSLANLQAEVENLNDKEKLAVNYLKYQMNYPVSEPLVVSDNLATLLTKPLPEDLEGEIDYAENSAYAVVESAIRLNELNIKRYKAGYLPQLIAFGAYNVNWQANKVKDGNWSDNSIIGVQLNVPIFDGFNKRAKIQRARLQLESVKLRKERLERGIDLQVENARVSYKNAQKRIGDLRKNLELAERIYNTSQIKYKEGVGSSLEITQAEQALFQAQSNSLLATYDLLVAKVNLDKALGK